MYSRKLAKEKASIKVPSTRNAITSPSPIESIHSSISTHSSNTLSPTISNTSSNDNQSPSTNDSSSTGSRSRSSSTDITNAMTEKQEQRTQQKEPKNTNQNKYRSERRRKLSDPRCFPLLYECYAQARVRIKYELSSQHLTDLPVGSVVTVEEIKDRRARISAPIHGWLSVISKDGNTILMILNKQTAKIGGKVMFNNYRHHNGNMPITAKIIDYNQNYDMHKVQHKNGKTEWLNLKDKNITYIPNGVPSMVNPIKQTEKFFLQFFMKDYPQFRPKQSPSSYNNHYNAISQQSRAEQLRQAQILHQLHHQQMQLRNQRNKHNVSKSKQFKLNGHNHGSASYSKHSQHGHISHNQKILHQMNRFHLNAMNNHNNKNNNNHRSISHRNGIDKNQNGNRCYSDNDKMRYNALNTMKALNAKRNSDLINQKKASQCKDDDKKEQQPTTATSTETKKKKTDPEEFRRKIKEIERKIIDHLHKRGYYEDSKEFWIYIRKAKEMAIEKAKKERAKYLAREKAEAEAREKAKAIKLANTNINNNNNGSDI